MNLTRGERFKDARNVHNQHGKQTMAEVEAATGLGKSLIQALEDDANDRSVGYDKVVILANHYHVTTDYLLGFTNDPHPKHTAIDDLRISAKAIAQIRWFNSDDEQASELSYLLEDHLFWLMIGELIAYKKASAAEEIFDSIKLKYHTSDEDSCIDEMQSEENAEAEIIAAINDSSLDKTIRRYLSSLLYINSLGDSNDTGSDDAYILNFVPSEMHEQRARKYLHAIFERLNPNDPIHGLRKFFMEAAKAGRVDFDETGDFHWSSKRSSKKRKDDG